jgi:YbgC/YbaW family acyl-CoA thioester hydrolase
MQQQLESFYTVRFSDCDPFRHLNNARYIDYLLNAREDHLKEHYDMDLASFYKKGVGWVVMQHEISYLRPANINEKICIRSGLLDIGAEHLLVEMLMLDEKASHLKAVLHTRFIPVSLTTGKKEPHGAEFMDFISDKLIPGLDPETISLKDRISYWQRIIKPITIA